MSRNKTEPQIRKNTCWNFLRTKELRVGDDAIKRLKQILEAYGREIAEKTQSIVEHTGKKTITARDVDYAMKG